MKKLIFTLIVGLFAYSASAQEWAIGGRVGNGVQVVGQYYKANQNYWEGRLGVFFLDGFGLDVSALHNWNMANMDWTPRAGKWFFDLGAGVNVGVGKDHFHIGPQGVAKLGIAFSGAPVNLSLDWSPTFGVSITDSKSKFYGMGMASFGITCVYRF